MKFYRYDLGYYYHDSPRLELLVLDLLKETPGGYWIGKKTAGDHIYYKKWIKKGARRSFAYPTKEEALNSFIVRKERQIQHCKRDERNAQKGLELAKEIQL